MSRENPGGERNHNIWAPWRMEYIDMLAEGDDGCFICRLRDDAEKDTENLVLWRGTKSFAMLNLFPYAGGHTMVAPYEHVASLADLDGPVMREMMEQVRDIQQLLTNVIRAQGFNIGMNVGRCAGAGLPDHLHIHVVPRWPGDTNFMSVLGKVRVIPQALSDLYEQLTKAAGKLKLPALSS